VDVRRGQHPVHDSVGVDVLAGVVSRVDGREGREGDVFGGGEFLGEDAGVGGVFVVQRVLPGGAGGVVGLEGLCIRRGCGRGVAG